MSKHNFHLLPVEKRQPLCGGATAGTRPAPFKWHTHTGALQFRYQYAIMPKGLMSRLIVRLSDYIEVLDSTEIVWKKAPSCKYQGTTAFAGL